MKSGVRSLASLTSFLLLGLSLAAQDIQVNSADPPSAPQGTINLNVTVSGKGFKRGAVAKFFVTGTTNPGGVTVNSTTFVGGTQLVANIDVADTAVIANFDVEVQNSDGRTGKGTELFAVTAAGAVSSSGATLLIRADFRDGLTTDRMRSDGQPLRSACGAYDYADKYDPCQPGYGGRSYVNQNGSYFMETNFVYDPNPTRWLVLEFTDGLSGSTCPGLDTKLKSYAGRAPTAFSPEDPNPCIDLVAVRLYLDKAYAVGAQFTPVRVFIDGPDACATCTTGVQWNGKYELDFVNPASMTPDPLDPNTITVTTITGAEQAELWTINQGGKKKTKLGTYRMPFQVKLTKAGQLP